MTLTYEETTNQYPKHILAALERLISFWARKSKRQRQGPANVRQGLVGGRRMDGPVRCGRGMDGIALRDLAHLAERRKSSGT